MKKFRNFLFIILPLVLFFSYHPVIALAETSEMHIELSLPLIWLGLFAVCNLPKQINLKIMGFPIFLLLSCLWSRTPLRGVLVSGVVTCIYLAILGCKQPSENTRSWMRFIAKTSVVCVCCFCFLQALLDVLGASRNVTLLCEGCTYESFGFPHPNGFAIEPQFMGNLLIIPALLAINSLLKNKIKISQVVFALLTITTLFFTFSRGAMFGFIVGAVYLLIRNYHEGKKLLRIAVVIPVAFGISLCTQGFLAEINPNVNDSFSTAVAKSLNQTTLGTIDLRDKTTQNTSTTIFDGYVPESSNRRLELAGYALDVWSDSLKNVFIGTGAGSAGQAMFDKYPTQGHAKEIVQNQYLELLLETGIIGIALLALSVKEIFRVKKIKFGLSEQSIALAFSVTLLFFSGLPNALHIYLLPLLCYNCKYETGKNRLSRI